MRLARARDFSRGGAGGFPRGGGGDEGTFKKSAGGVPVSPSVRKVQVSMYCHDCHHFHGIELEYYSPSLNLSYCIYFAFSFVVFQNVTFSTNLKSTNI